MRIGFDAKRLFENETGLGTYSRNLVNALVREYPEYEYYLYTPSKPSDKHIREYLDMPNIKIRYAEKSNHNYWRTRGIIKDLMSDELQVYHGLSNEIPYGIHKTSIKTVVTIHDLLFKQFPEDYALIDRMIYDWKSKYAFKNADKVIAISQATRSSLSEQYGIPDSSRVTTIYQDIDPVFSNTQHQEVLTQSLEELGINGDYILFVGNDSKRKNLTTVLKAVSHLKEKQNLVLVLNKASLNHQCSGLVKNLGLTGQIKILTKVSLKHLQALYIKSICLVYPSIGEGWGLPVEEAIACNSNVLLPNYPPFNELDSSNKFFLDSPTDPVGMARSLEKVMLTKGSNVIEENLRNASSRKIISIYQYLLKS